MRKSSKDRRSSSSASSEPSEPSSSGQIQAVDSSTKSTRVRDTGKFSQSVWSVLDAKLGGREGLLEAAMSSHNPKCKDLIPYLLDKAYRTWSIRKLAGKAGMTVVDVADLFRDQKWLEVYMALHEELPSVVGDAIVDAKASYQPCDACKGGTIPGCYVCSGEGRTRRPGDKDKLNFVGEATGLVGKRGPLVQNNIQVNAPSGNTVSFEELMKKATIQIKPKQIEPVAEAEVIED